jgi:hypothetical protein
LPSAGGCCHWNIEPAHGLQEVTWDMLAPMRIGPDETVEFMLKCYEVAYYHGPQSEVMIDPDELGLPATFGVGTEYLADEEVDWSEWIGQWCLDDVAVQSESPSGEFPR